MLGGVGPGDGHEGVEPGQRPVAVDPHRAGVSAQEKVLLAGAQIAVAAAVPGQMTGEDRAGRDDDVGVGRPQEGGDPLVGEAGRGHRAGRHAGVRPHRGGRARPGRGPLAARGAGAPVDERAQADPGGGRQQRVVAGPVDGDHLDLGPQAGQGRTGVGGGTDGAAHAVGVVHQEGDLHPSPPNATWAPRRPAAGGRSAGRAPAVPSPIPRSEANGLSHSHPEIRAKRKARPRRVTPGPGLRPVVREGRRGVSPCRTPWPRGPAARRPRTPRRGMRWPPRRPRAWCRSGR